MADLIDDQTIALVGSACNYGYGTIDPIEDLGELALSRGVGLHVDGCLGGFILPLGEELGYDIPAFDFRVPGVTTISADTHKYGYGLKGTSVLLFRDRALRNSQYFFLTDWTGGKYCSPGMDGSRSGGLLAATWASMVSLGREGYRELRQARSSRPRRRCRTPCDRHPELRIMGDPTFLLLLHLRRVRHLPRQRLHAAEGLAVQRPAVPERHPHGRHPPADPGRGDRGVRHRPRRGRRVRQGARRRDAAVAGAIYGGVAGGHTTSRPRSSSWRDDDMLDAAGAAAARPREHSCVPHRPARPRGRPGHRRRQGRALVTTRGEPSAGARPRDRAAPGGGAHPGRRRVVGAGRRADPRSVALTAVPATTSSPSRHRASGRARCRSTSTACPSGPA